MPSRFSSLSVVVVVVVVVVGYDLCPRAVAENYEGLDGAMPKNILIASLRSCRRSNFLTMSAEDFFLSVECKS